MSTSLMETAYANASSEARNCCRPPGVKIHAPRALRYDLRHMDRPARPSQNGLDLGPHIGGYLACDASWMSGRLREPDLNCGRRT